MGMTAIRIALTLAHRRPQLAILLSAITALGLLLLGVALYDVVTRWRDTYYVMQGPSDAASLEALVVAFALLGGGGALSGAGTVLALGRAAQRQPLRLVRWLRGHRTRKQ
jgi:hypothetical protein